MTRECKRSTGKLHTKMQWSVYTGFYLQMTLYYKPRTQMSCQSLSVRGYMASAFLFILTSEKAKEEWKDHTYINKKLKVYNLWDIFLLFCQNITPIARSSWYFKWDSVTTPTEMK